MLLFFVVVWVFYVWVGFFLFVCFIVVIAPYATTEGMSPSLFC